GDEFVIASGQRRTVRDFVDTTFQLLGLDWKRYVEEDAAILKRRKGILIGNASKLREATGWVPETSFTQMIREMIVAEGVKLG
ncbi:MAG: GDP-mannose 4,6-dehydratase, partial [Bdellovibrionota bacterium]